MPNTDNYVYQPNDDLYGKKINSIPAKKQEIGIDVDNTIQKEITGVQSSQINISQLEAFTNISQSRDQLYTMLDNMANDPMVAAALEIYTEDATETNDDGRIMWVEAPDDNVRKYVEFLLDTLNVDKNMYKWVYSLCKYGDIYLRLFRESEVKDDLLKDTTDIENSKRLVESLDKENQQDKQLLEENVNIKIFSKNDKFIHYVEMVPNPAEMFELTKFGKSYAYIHAPITSMAKTYNSQSTGMSTYNYYRFNRKDVDLYGATEYVHGALEDNQSRVPEEVQIFLTDTAYNNTIGGPGEYGSFGNDSGSSLSYQVKRGQSILYPTYKAWRNKSLLENSVLLNRITKSSITRVIQVEVGDMPKEQVQPHLYNLKSLIEQKSAINENNAMEEYVNPGPIENIIYVPTRGGQGALSVNQIGEDVDVKSLADLEYFKDSFYGSLKIPKQYLGDTDDTTGFNGGTSLSIVSSRYAKAVKRIQQTIIQTITDAVNIFLLDKGLDTYVNSFTLHMMPPTTQEEIDRRESTASKISITRDVLDILSNIEDPAAKLRITKDLLADIVDDPDIMSIIQEQIDKMEEQESANSSDNLDDSFDDEGFGSDLSGGPSFSSGANDFSGNLNDFASEDVGSDYADSSESSSDEDSSQSSFGEPQAVEMDTLPSMNSAGIDFADANSQI